MATIKRFEDLECWQEARKLVNIVYGVTNSTNFREDIDLKRQMRRSTISVMANIAEGFHRNSNKDFLKFLDYSRSSIAETLSHGYIGLDQNYIVAKEFENLQAQAEIVWKQLNRFVSYLNRSNQSN
ncbi:MAG: four helix bundle protein [Desulfobacterales bacterium]|nr:four helix bundle protein [Desulfobacterales bacterium]